MTLWDKLKLIIWLDKVYNSLAEGGSKMGNLLQKVDGLKSIAGLLIVVAYYVVPQFTSVHIPDVVMKLGVGLASAGLAHKLEKGTGIISAVLDGVKKGLDSITAKENPPTPPQS